MKAIVAAVFIMILFTFGFAQKRMTDAEREQLKGRVKSISKSDAPAGVLTSAGTNSPVILTIYYDENGRLIGTSNSLIGRITADTFVESDSRIYQATRPSDDAPKNLSNTERMFAPDSPYTSIRELDFDVRGNLVKQIVYTNKKQLVSTITFEYDAKRRVIKLTDSDRLGYAVTSAITYDKDGLETVEILTDTGKNASPGGLRTTFSDYILDAHGNWTRRTQSNTVTANGEVINKKFINSRTITYYDDARPLPR